MRHGSLFSGIGGFDLAAEWMGWENVFHCEWKEFNQRVLKYYWPNATSYSDITKTDFSIHRGTIDILTGGFPCQPYSVAGKRKGKEDDRHLWPEMLRAIREIQPSWIVGENVPGLVNWGGGMVFEEVQNDLENEGYKVIAVILPSCSVGAEHKRERVWFIANLHKVSGECLEKFRIQDSQQRNEGKRSKGRELLHMVSSRDLLEEWKEKGEEFNGESPLISDSHGVSKGLDSITFSEWCNKSNESFGNAIVPQVAFEIFKAINKVTF